MISIFVSAAATKRQQTLSIHAIFIQEAMMPEISRFYGIVIKMLYEAGGKHNKPHVHVEYGEYEASVGIDGEVIAVLNQNRI